MTDMLCFPGMRNISIVGNTFRSAEGCGPNFIKGCDFVCANISCVLDHIDPGLRDVVHVAGNVVHQH